MDGNLCPDNQTWTDTLLREKDFESSAAAITPYPGTRLSELSSVYRVALLMDGKDLTWLPEKTLSALRATFQSFR